VLLVFLCWIVLEIDFGGQHPWRPLPTPVACHGARPLLSDCGMRVGVAWRAHRRLDADANAADGSLSICDQRRPSAPVWLYRGEGER
jgi:hypothetical protein